MFIPSCPIFLSQLIYKYCVCAASYAVLDGVPGIGDVHIHRAAPELGEISFHYRILGSRIALM